MDARNTVAQSATRDVMACIGCNDCLIACPLPQASLVTIAELNHAVEQTVVTNPAVVDFVTACTQCRQCVPACPADLSRADMVLFNKMKVEDTVPNYTLLLQVGQQVSPSPWALDDLTARMAHVALFAGVPATDVRALLQKVTLRQLAAGELLVREGEFFDRMCVILSGGLEQWAEGHGGVRVHVLDLGPGSFFGELAVIADQPEPYAVVARELSVVLEIPKTALQRLMDTSPSFKTTMDELYRRRALFTYARRPDVLGGFPEQAVEEIFSRAQLRMLRAGEVVLKEDAPPGDVYLVRTGFLKVSRRVDAEREAVLVYFREGDLFGLLPLLHGERGHAYTVLATTRAEVVVIPGSHFFAVMSRYPNARAALEAGQGLEVERVARSALFSPPSPALGPKDATRAVMSMDVLVEKGLATGSEVLVVDTNVCVNCQNCVDACARRHKYGRLQLRGLQVDHFLFPTACRHCERPGVPPVQRQRHRSLAERRDHHRGGQLHRLRCVRRAMPLRQHQHAPRRAAEAYLHGEADGLLARRPRAGASPRVAQPERPRKAVKCDLCAGYDDYACVSACPVGAAFRIDPRSILPADAAQLGLAMKKEGR
ncbi:MAG: cyclic nucleotide-binding domain-containing protein [Myxococcales bacterium]|nr:cyclic nucleotide-binding domain-containing protein [Myxococcales bacterium]